MLLGPLCRNYGAFSEVGNTLYSTILKFGLKDCLVAFVGNYHVSVDRNSVHWIAVLYIQ